MKTNKKKKPAKAVYPKPKTIKVVFPGPMNETHHQKLGTLIKDKPFDLEESKAQLYLKSGLLEKAASNKAGN